MAHLRHHFPPLNRHRAHFALGKWFSQVWAAFFDHLADKLAQVEGGGLHFELIIGAFLAVRMGVASAVDVGEAEDEALDVHALFDALFESVRLVEDLGGFDLVAVEADEDITCGRLFTVGATALVPERAVVAELGREAELEAALRFMWIAAGGGLVIRTGER